jgi:hypothetical protein
VQSAIESFWSLASISEDHAAAYKDRIIHFLQDEEKFALAALVIPSLRFEHCDSANPINSTQRELIEATSEMRAKILRLKETKPPEPNPLSESLDGEISRLIDADLQRATYLCLGRGSYTDDEAAAIKAWYQSAPGFLSRQKEP